ncbi:MAG: alpha/beta fold hydrolase [Verrucomicrobia bacterium]|nr:alpha/beta fold hydrolase [Verrucomicrobiota bacterium]
MTIVTLVHGTFAKNAAWTHESSPLAAALKERIPGEVRIEAVNWSGHNLHVSRYGAAQRLREHIKSLAKTFPGARQFIIAHSHGGNVAMYALNDGEVRKLVSGVVSLSTPFIMCRPRRLPEDLLSPLIVLISPFIFIFAGIWLRFRIPIQVWMVVLFGLAMGVQAVLSRIVLGHWKGGLQSIRQKLADSLAQPAMSSRELLIVRAPGDEASAALGASTFGLWLFGKLSGVGEQIHEFAARVQRVLGSLKTERKVLGSVGCVLASALVFYLGLNSEEWRTGHGMPMSSFLTGALLLLIGIAFWSPHEKADGLSAFDQWDLPFQVIYVALAMPCLLVCALFSAAFGHDVAFLVGFFEFSIETSPIGNFSVLSLSASTAGGLWHSLPYSDKEAFEAIVKWINQGREPTQPACDRTHLFEPLVGLVCSYS